MAMTFEATLKDMGRDSSEGFLTAPGQPCLDAVTFARENNRARLVRESWPDTPVPGGFHR
jgi:hypothetical protein